MHGVKFCSAVSSPPGECELMKVVPVAPGQEALLHGVRLDAHPVALALDVHLYTVQQIFDQRGGLPRPERHHRLLSRVRAVNGIIIEAQILLRPQHADDDVGVACGDGLGPGDTNQNLEDKFKTIKAGV